MCTVCVATRTWKEKVGPKRKSDQEGSSINPTDRDPQDTQDRG